MTSDLLPGTTRFLKSVVLAVVFVVPATGAQTTNAPASARSAFLARAGQSQPAPVASAAAPGHASIRYFCYSTDPKQHVVYFSDLFDLPDSGFDAQNYMDYVLAREDFQIYLVDKYKYPEADNLADCSYVNTATTANAAATLAAKKRRMAAQAVAAKKQVVQTGWKDTPPPPPSADDDPIGPGGFITAPSR